MTVTKQKASKSLRLSLARQLPVALATVPKNYNSNKHFASALDLNIRALFLLFCGALNQSEAHDKKNNSRSLFSLARLAGLYSAISTEHTHPPNRTTKGAHAGHGEPEHLHCKRSRAQRESLRRH